LKRNDDGNFLRAQIECNELRGAIVQWKGYVKTIELASVENFFGTLLSYLPYGLEQRLRCFYGDEAKMEENSSILRQCSLSSNNVYTFKIEIESMSVSGKGKTKVCDRNERGPCVPNNKEEPAIIRLSASHGFQEMVIDLRKRDLIKFTASFDDNVGLKYPTRMTAHKLECIQCQREENNSTITDELYGGEEGLWGKLYDALCSVFNFIFAPLITLG